LIYEWVWKPISEPCTVLLLIEWATFGGLFSSDCCKTRMVTWSVNAHVDIKRRKRQRFRRNTGI
jgi:hypothetical protein